jgi:cytochrome b6-f complex iron-sulfur subunit
MLEDDKKTGPPESSSPLGRRKFFIRMGLGSIAMTAAGTGIFGYKFLSPNVLYEPSPIVNAGKPEGYPLDSVTLDLAAGIYVVHEQEGFFALTATCKHLGCLTVWKPELGIIACPCHGSQFHRDGTKITGPATGPLPHLRMWLSDEGDLMVDRASVASAKQFVKV